MPGMPSTPLAVEIGAIERRRHRFGPPPIAYSCQPSRSSTMSPTLKPGLWEARPAHGAAGHDVVEARPPPRGTRSRMRPRW